MQADLYSSVISATKLVVCPFYCFYHPFIQKRSIFSSYYVPSCKLRAGYTVEGKKLAFLSSCLLTVSVQKAAYNSI